MFPFNASSMAFRLRLSPIPLPNFNCNIENWESFFYVFRAMVHNDVSLYLVQKFYYLRSCLSGLVLDIVSSIPMAERNHEVFFQILKHRYDNKSLVIQTHIRAHLNIPKVDTGI